MPPVWVKSLFAVPLSILPAVTLSETTSAALLSVMVPVPAELTPVKVTALLPALSVMPPLAALVSRPATERPVVVTISAEAAEPLTFLMALPAVPLSVTAPVESPSFVTVTATSLAVIFEPEPCVTSPAVRSNLSPAVFVPVKVMLFLSVPSCATIVKSLSAAPDEDSVSTRSLTSTSVLDVSVTNVASPDTFLISFPLCVRVTTVAGKSSQDVLSEEPPTWPTAPASTVSFLPSPVAIALTPSKVSV